MFAPMITPQLIRLVPVDATEAAAVREMAELIWPATYRDIISAQQIRYMLDRMYALPMLAEQINSPEHRFFWIEAEAEDLRCGFLAVEWDESDNSVQLQKLYLLPEQQGKGCGSAAWQALEELLRSGGCTQVSLRVNRFNATALKYYEKCGFTTQKTDCRDIGGGFVMDDFILKKSLRGV